MQKNINFLIRWLQNFTSVGAFAPLGEDTNQAIWNAIGTNVSFCPKHIVELWWGIWNLTTNLLQFFPTSLVTTYEIQDSFIDSLKKLKKTYKNLRVKHKSWAAIADEKQADVVVSTIPFTVLDKDEWSKILMWAYKILKPYGVLIIVQYTWVFMKKFSDELQHFSLISKQRERDIFHPVTTITTFR